MKRGQIVIGIGVGLIVSTGIYLLIKKYVLSGFKTSVLSNAKKEWKLWGSTLVVGGKEKQSGEEECSDIYRDRVGEYWKKGVNRNKDGCDRDEPWSSAFISFIMKKSGAGKDFPYSSAHTNYIRPFIQNRKQNLKSDFKAYKLHEKKAELGDLVCYPRQSGVDYDTTYSYKSHCDIVVGVNRIKRNIEVIGGNVGDGVTKKVLNTDNKGYLNDTSYEWFTIIKNNK
jgi:hypothetical protein|tara:strand:- start:1678 stop:2355 length:678 start_codon:yes stop_codon:yes gene_type:complete